MNVGKSHKFLLSGLFQYVFELLIMLPEKSQEGKRLLSNSHHGVLYLFRGDESQAVLYPPVMLFDFFSQIIYGPVDGKGIHTASISPSIFRIPYGWVDGYFCAYLFPLGIYAYLAQQLARSVLADFRAVYVNNIANVLRCLISVLLVFPFIILYFYLVIK